MPISNLTIPFPDFKYGEIMNPDAFDTNNEAIKTKVNEIATELNSSTTRLNTLESNPYFRLAMGSYVGYSTKDVWNTVVFNTNSYTLSQKVTVGSDNLVFLESGVYSIRYSVDLSGLNFNVGLAMRISVTEPGVATQYYTMNHRGTHYQLSNSGQFWFTMDEIIRIKADTRITFDLMIGESPRSYAIRAVGQKISSY